MGCCQAGPLGSDVDLDRNSSEPFVAAKPIYLIQVPSESEQKFEPPPSFGSHNKMFAFDSNKEILEIN